MPRKYKHTSLPPPYLKRVWIDEDSVPDRNAYPFCLPMFREPNFELEFDAPVTIIVGENGAGKSTLLEGIAVLAGFDEAGGGPGYRPVDHSNALEENGGLLAEAMQASWLPKVGRGWSAGRRPTSCRTRTARGSCASSRNAVSLPESSSSMSRNPRCRCRASSTS
jgi:hypothetical protein